MDRLNRNELEREAVILKILRKTADR